MDPLAATLGALSLSSFMVSMYFSAPRRIASTSRTDLPASLLVELELATDRVASLVPFAVDLVRTHEHTRTGRRGGAETQDPGPLPLQTLSRALDTRLAKLDAAHFKEHFKASGGPASAAAALLAAGSAADTYIATLLAAHPLRLAPARILTAQKSIVAAEIAAHTAAAAESEAGNSDFDSALAAHMLAAGAAPGAHSLVLPVLAKCGPQEAARATLWVHCVGYAMSKEIEGVFAEYKGFTAAFNRIADKQRADLRDLGLNVT